MILEFNLLEVLKQAKDKGIRNAFETQRKGRIERYQYPATTAHTRSATAIPTGRFIKEFQLRRGRRITIFFSSRFDMFDIS